jgi:hypothetical protein
MYRWIGIGAWLFPVNESVWEHIKIIFIPYLIYTFIELCLLKPSDKYNYFAIKSIALIAMPVVMIVLYFTYTGIIGRNYLFIDGIIGILSILAGYLISLRLILIDYKIKKKAVYISIAVIICVLLIIFTYLTPHINLFYDPIAKKFGR